MTRTNISKCIGTFLRRLRNGLGWITGRGAVIPKQDWERQYQAGQWDFIAHEKERYTQLAQLVGHVFAQLPAGQRTLLDMGCGEGIMLQHLLTQGVVPERYVGVDLSETAIAKAREHFSANNHGSSETFDLQWIATDMDIYLQNLKSAQFGLVLFNESLCYVPDPLATWKLGLAHTYALCSLYKHPRTRIILNLVRNHGPVQETRVGQWTMILSEGKVR